MSRIDFKHGGLPETTQVVALQGREAISELYGFDLFVIISETACKSLVLDDLVGVRGTIELREVDTDEACERYHGIATEVDVLHVANDFALLRVWLTPELFKLTESEHSRIFTDMDVGQVIEKVLDDYALDCEVEMALNAEHPTEEHICQYRESDFDFLARWMQREGIFFYFQHDGDKSEKLVITDDNGGRPEVKSAIRYEPAVGQDAAASSALRSLRQDHHSLPTELTVRDYDYAKPALDVAGTQSVSSEGGTIVTHEHRTFAVGDADRLAKILEEELTSRKRRLHGSGTVFGLRPGYLFELEGHPRDNGRYAVVAIVHEVAQADSMLELIDLDITPGYRVQVECLAEDVPFRAPLATPWPRIRGYQLGVVAGPAESEYAQLDDQGRYVVRMMFDESDNEGEAVSTRIRMLQPHTGSPEGWHFPLRAGTEVVVQFLGGDPDRPVIAGAVPNAVNPSLVTKKNQTQNVLQTGGLTRLEIEDEDGKQYIWVHTPPEDTFLNLGHPTLASHNITLHSDADCLYDIGSDQLINVGGHLDEKVTGDVKETYKAKQTSTIHGPQKTTVNKAVDEMYLSEQKTTVTKAPRMEMFQNGQDTIVLGARTETYSASQQQQVFSGTQETFVGGWTRKVTGATTEFHDGTLSEVVAGNLIQICPSGVTETYGDTTGIYASLTWISPGVQIKAPKVEYTAPNRFELTGTWDCTKWTENTSKPWDAGASAIKIEVVGMATAAAGSKREAAGFVFALSGGSVEGGQVNVKLSGVYIGPVANDTN